MSTQLPLSALREAMRIVRTHAPEHEKHMYQTGSKSLEELHDQLTDAFGGLPETLWIQPDLLPDNIYLKQLSLRQDWQESSLAERIRRRYFKPMLTAAPNEWMDADAIRDLIRHKTKRFKRFAFLGVHHPNGKIAWKTPSEYATVWGIVWNTSLSPTGQHWVSALFFPRLQYMEYFDSMGASPNNLMKQQISLITKGSIWRKPTTRPIRHQMGSSQCGMYAAWFIIQRVVNHVTWDEIQSKRVPDEDMANLRKEYFRPPDPELVAALESLKL